MGNKIAIIQEPEIMTVAFLEEKIIQDKGRAEDLDVSELRKLVKMDGLDWNLIFNLDLEGHRLVNIADLWRFKLLTKLEMPNNLIEKIEGLECLSNLESLDLSFNYIKYITGMENLKNIKHLNLTTNEIVILENMEHMEKLEVFLIRHNRISSFDNVIYLAQFENLFSLGIGENPVMKDHEAGLRVIAALPQLKFLDFFMITVKQLQEVFNKYPPTSKSTKAEDEHENVSIADIEVKKSSTQEGKPADKEAYVEGLSNGQGFETLLASDKNYQLLHSFPPASSITKYHHIRINELFNEWHQIGLGYYEQIHQEKMEFEKMAKEAAYFALGIAREEESKFIAMKGEIPKELCFIYQKRVSDEEKENDIQFLKEKYEKELKITGRNLMLSTCLCIDLLLNMSDIFKKEILQINAKYIEDVENFCESIMDANESCASQLKEFYFDIFDTGFNYDLEIKSEEGEVIELDPAFVLLLKKKEFVEMALQMAMVIHSSLLSERISNLKSHLENDMLETLDRVIDKDAFDKQSEQTRNGVVFCNKQKYFIERIFSKTSVFKHHLGYR